LVQLKTFGKVRLADCGFSRPKPLLLLAYLTLEGPQERAKLARLFWNGKNGKASLSVVLSQFKKECAVQVLSDQPGIDPLPSLIACDAPALLEATEHQNVERALELYQGSFLQDLSKPLDDLELSGELLDWVLEKREWYAAKMQNLLLDASERALSAGDVKGAQTFAERAYNLPDAPELEPAMLSKLQRILGRTTSDVTVKLERTIKANLADLPDGAQRVFLALSIQEKINLTIVRAALELPLTEVARAQEDLFMAGLIDTDAKVTAPDLASNWLRTHSSERFGLLIALARATPPEDAFSYYEQLYQLTQGFGGIGDFQRAHTAYCAQAKSAMDRLEFARAITLLEPVFAVQKTLDAEPHSQSCFLLSYALERTGRFKDAFEVISTLPAAKETPNTIALKSNLLWRIGKNPEARAAAEQALEGDLEWLWAKATAHNTLGYLASSSGDFTEAASSFKKSASLYRMAGDQHRWVGALNNYANELSKTAERAEGVHKSPSDVQVLRAEAIAAYGEALQALDHLVGANDALRARILINMGLLVQGQKEFVKAEGLYKEAQTYLGNTKPLGLLAHLHYNLGTVYYKLERNDESKRELESAIELASSAGDMVTKMIAMARLGVLEDNEDDIVLIAEMLQSSKNAEFSRKAFSRYGQMLREHFENAIRAQKSIELRRILVKLQDFYQKFELLEKAREIGETIADINNGSTLEFNNAKINGLFENLTYEYAVKHA
jgi:tetratricopeptide (TPR) repeat protein